MELVELARILLIADGAAALLTVLWACFDPSIIPWKREEDRLNPLARRMYIYIVVLRGMVRVVSGCQMAFWPAIAVYVLEGGCCFLGFVEGSMDWRAVIFWMVNWGGAGFFAFADGFQA